jgi:hypothetical protein
MTLRTRKEINQDYTNQAAQYGDLCFKNKYVKTQLDGIEKRLTDLSTEKASDDHRPQESVPTPPPESVL